MIWLSSGCRYYSKYPEVSHLASKIDVSAIDINMPFGSGEFTMFAYDSRFKVKKKNSHHALSNGQSDRLLMRRATKKLRDVRIALLKYCYTPISDFEY